MANHHPQLRTDWFSANSGWRQRAVPHSSPDEFRPALPSLAFAILTSTMRRPRMFNLALFTPNIAVDGACSPILLDQSDWDALVRLADASVRPPQRWRIHHSATCQPFIKVYVPVPARDGAEGGESMEMTSVYGYAKGLRALERPRGAADDEVTRELPNAPYELFGLVDEAGRAVDTRPWREDDGPVPNLVADIDAILSGRPASTRQFV